MVTIMDYKSYQSEDGKSFYALELQGGIEIVKSKETGRNYLTARKAVVSCTFDEQTCKALKGTQIDGIIKRVEVEPYSYVVEATGEELTLSHRYEFMSEDQHNQLENVIEPAMVI